MVRRYSRSKGKAGSKKPHGSKPAWIRYKAKEVELLIVKLSKAGKTTSQIGMHLRDTYGVPDVRKVIGKKISQVLAGKKLLKKLPEDLSALIKRTIALREHIAKNKHDMPSKRGLIITESKIKRLTKYYTKSGKLPKDWRFDPTQAEMYIE